MHHPSLNRAAARALLGAATLLAAPTGAASAAAVQLSTIGSELLLCRAELNSLDGKRYTATPAWQWVVSYDRAYFDFGKVLEEINDHSPRFASLTLSCVRRDRIMVGELPHADERWYSIELDRFDPLWGLENPYTDASEQGWYSELPRDGIVVALRIGSTGVPHRPLHINDAGFWREDNPFGTYLDYSMSGHAWHFIDADPDPYTDSDTDTNTDTDTDGDGDGDSDSDSN